MKLLIQRVHSADVSVSNVPKESKKTNNEIQKGMLIFVCFVKSDENAILEKMAQKISKLRIFEDDAGKMNLNLSQAEGEVLCVSQFTLSWGGQGGNRPSFDDSMDPVKARDLYDKFCDEMKNQGLGVKKGFFGEHMDLKIQADGPCTFFLDLGLK